MPRSAGGKRRVAALSVLMVALGGGCSDTRTRSETASAAAEPGRAGTAGELCLVGRATSEGVECQAFRATGGGLYTLVGNLGGLGGDDACVCGAPVELSTCMQGTTIAVTRIGPRHTCP